MPQNSTHKPQGVAFVTDDAAAAYKHFLPRVEAIPEERLAICRADLALARLNVERGVDAIRPHLDRLRAEMPKVDVNDLLELPVLALGLVFAGGRVTGAPASPRDIKDHIARLRPLRAHMLDQLGIFAGFGIIPSDVVNAIRCGKGPLDAARDGVAIAAIFRDNAALFAGKHPFTEEHINELSEHGNWLIQHITPTGARVVSAPREGAAVIRDRFWTALLEGYPALRKAGVYLFGEEGIEARIPALQSRAATRASYRPSAIQASARARVGWSET